MHKTSKRLLWIGLGLGVLAVDSGGRSGFA